ncbi:Bifunctional adenosylcobalamin biosynthesis protein CobU [subsurface metagenome]
MLFVATAEAGDEEMHQRIEKHKEGRPATWDTLEATTSIGNQISQKMGGARVVVVDCMALLINNLFGQYNDQTDASLIEKKVADEIDELIECIKHADATFIIVTNEIGLGLVPTNRMGRLYRDLLGKVNQRLAEVAEEVYLMVAGLPVQIKPPQHIG